MIFVFYSLQKYAFLFRCGWQGWYSVSSPRTSRVISPLYQGLIGLGFNLPMLLGPFIGAVVDRYQRKTILRITSLIALFAAATMAVLLIGKLPNYWTMFAVVLTHGFSLVFYVTAMITSTHDIVTDVKVLGNGVAVVNATNRIAMFFGYSIGGLCVSYFGEQFSYWLDAVLYLLSFLLLLRITTTVVISEQKQPILKEFTAGLGYLKKSPPVFMIVFLLGLMGFFAWPFIFQIPAVNRYYLHGTPATLGMLMSIGGIGGIVGAFLMSARKSSLGLNKIFISTTLLLGVSLILLAFCRSVSWAIPVLFLIDFSLMVTLTVGTVFVQQLVPPGYQGRMMGIISMAAFGSIPLGSTIFYGGIGEPFGVMMAFTVAGIYFIAQYILVLVTSAENSSICCAHFCAERINLSRK